jgi:hypothetical protein
MQTRDDDDTTAACAQARELQDLLNPIVTLMAHKMNNSAGTN